MTVQQGWPQRCSRDVCGSSTSLVRLAQVSYSSCAHKTDCERRFKRFSKERRLIGTGLTEIRRPHIRGGGWWWWGCFILLMHGYCLNCLLKCGFRRWSSWPPLWRVWSFWRCANSLSYFPATPLRQMSLKCETSWPWLFLSILVTHATVRLLTLTGDFPIVWRQVK